MKMLRKLSIAFCLLLPLFAQAAAPTFIGSAQSAFAIGTGDTTLTTGAWTVTPNAGDVLVAGVLIGDYDATQAIVGVAGCSTTWTQVQLEQSVSHGQAAIYSGTATSSGACTITATKLYTSGGADKFIVLGAAFRGGTGIGASSDGIGTGSLSLAFSGTGTNSAWLCIGTDWNAVSGASRTWRTINSITPTSGNGLELVYATDATQSTVYMAYWNDVGASGSKTCGTTAPTGMQYAMAGVEVLGSGAGPTFTISRRPLVLQ